LYYFVIICKNIKSLCYTYEINRRKGKLFERKGRKATGAKSHKRYASQLPMNSFVVNNCKGDIHMKEKTIQDRISLLREELYRTSLQLNHELAHPKLVKVSQQLDQLLNQFTLSRQENI
jgi:Spo0E like sporulation regulatory protein